jgi:hypothetical protein
MSGRVHDGPWDMPAYPAAAINQINVKKNLGESK